MILYLIYGFCMVNCTVSPLSRFTAHLLKRVGVFLAQRSIQHLVCLKISIFSFHIFRFPETSFIVSFGSSTWLLLANIYTFFFFYRNFNILLMRNHMWDWMVEMFLIFSSIRNPKWPPLVDNFKTWHSLCSESTEPFDSRLGWNATLLIHLFLCVMWKSKMTATIGSSFSSRSYEKWINILSRKLEM
jgi:hypothetical protein